MALKKDHVIVLLEDMQSKFDLLIEGLPEGRVRRSFDGERARALYLGKLSVLDFLTG